MGSAMIIDMRILAAVLGLVLVLEVGCTRSGADANSPTTSEVAAESSAPVETEPTEDEAPVEVVDPNLCVLVAGEWEKCDGKLVQVDGTNADMVQQHPMVNGPDTEQGYLDVEGVGQIIIVSKKMVDCEGAMRVVGTLRGVGLGGDPGTKASYEGWSIEHAQFTCR
jgi:hypothetical protein